MINREAKILEKTYHDRMTVTRKQPVNDTESGETILKDVTIHEDIACALSHSGSAYPSKDNSHNRYTENDSYTIFSAPGIICQAGDKAMIVTASGQTYKGVTGKSFSYPSHTETALMIEMVV